MVELEALAEAAWWLCRTDESIAARQRAYAAFREAGDDRGAARAAARLFHDHFYRGERAVAVGWLRRGFRHLAVLSRQGLQFLLDVAGVLARLHSFLKPHGRLAAAVWGPPQTVQFAAPVPVIRAELQLPPPPAGMPGPFAFADAGQLAGLVEAAGFTDVETGTLTAVYQLGSPELATHWLRDVAPSIAAVVDPQPPEVQERVWAKVTRASAPYTTADGRVRLENQAVWATGRK